MWTFCEARELIVELEEIAPTYDFHVGLTGGVLYKDGPRKDLDIIVYSIRQKDLDMKKVETVFRLCGVEIGNNYGWMYKAMYEGKPIDILIPEFGQGQTPYMNEHQIAIEDLLIL